LGNGVPIVWERTTPALEAAPPLLCKEGSFVTRFFKFSSYKGGVPEGRGGSLSNSTKTAKFIQNLKQMNKMSNISD
jgi:hypothetical protein